MARNNAINFNRFSKYNFDFISTDEVILLEYLTFHYQRRTIDSVVHSRIESETGIKRNKQVRIFEELKEKGFVTWEFNGIRNYYTLHIDKVVDALPRLFIKVNKYVQQYYFYVQKPQLFKKNREKSGRSGTNTPKETKPVVISEQKNREPTVTERPKNRDRVLDNQMSLF